MLKNKIMLSMSLLLLSHLALDVNATESQKGFSGSFEPVVIGVDNDSGKLTGFYKNHTGWDDRYNAPKFSCVFYISGKLTGEMYHITTWYPGESESIEGSLRFLGVRNNTKIRIKLNDEHDGCWNVAPLLDEENGVEYSLDNRGKWHSVRVAADKAFFHSSPNPKTKRRAYVIKYDGLRVLDTQAGWVKAEFGTNRITRGWIKESDLFSDDFGEQRKHPIDKWVDACVEKDYSTVGMMNCGEQAVQKWDAELNRVYQALKKQLNADGKKALKTAQKAWLKYRDKEFKTIGAVYGSRQGTMWLPVLAFARADVVKNRVLQLKEYLDADALVMER
jgi:uncharacterized protein YecT (DUF1311 family)